MATAQKEKAPKPATAQKENSDHYQEWLVAIKDKKAEKLKCIRECVKITDEEAETLNAGILEGSNTQAKMYFKPE